MKNTKISENEYILDLESLNLGNNFTDSHLFEAIGQHLEIENIVHFLGYKVNYNAKITIIANIKFNYKIKETYVCNELYDSIMPYVEL